MITPFSISRLPRIEFGAGVISKLPELKSLGTDEPHLAEKIYSLQRRLEELLKDRSPIV